MWHRPVLTLKPSQQRYVRIVVGSAVALLTILTLGAYAVLQTKIAAFQSVSDNYAVGEMPARDVRPFPISVDPQEQRIVYTEEQELTIEEFVAPYLSTRTQDRWFDQLLARLGTQAWFQNLASPGTRIIVILPGERKEQIAHNIGGILRWDDAERERFLTDVTSRRPAFGEGTFFPGRYVVPADATPEYVANLVHERFAHSILERYPDELEAAVPLLDALAFASLLERESYHFSEMRVIAGIIWNRLFIDMPLQIDATLQYAKVEAGQSPNTWWPVPRPADKFIDSPFNTYQNPGLPPAPIANPGVASVIAVLNPLPTDCIFYFHDRRGGFHCSQTYDEHVQGIRRHYRTNQ